MLALSSWLTQLQAGKDVQEGNEGRREEVAAADARQFEGNLQFMRCRRGAFPILRSEIPRQFDGDSWSSFDSFKVGLQVEDIPAYGMCESRHY